MLIVAILCYISLAIISFFISKLLDIHIALFFNSLDYNIIMASLISIIFSYLESKIIWEKTVFNDYYSYFMSPISVGIFIYLILYLVGVIS